MSRAFRTAARLMPAVLAALSACQGVARAEEQEPVGTWSTLVARDGGAGSDRVAPFRRERQGAAAVASAPTRAAGGTAPRAGPPDPTPATGAPPSPPPTTPAARQPAAPPVEPAPQPDITQRYCTAAAPTAERARLEAERQQLAAVAAEVETRIKALEAAIAEHREWVGKRQSFQALAHESLLRIFGRMKVEAASAQLAQMDPIVAAAVLSRMEAKAAGAILAEIDPAKAARIAAVIAGAAEIEKPARVDAEAAR